MATQTTPAVQGGDEAALAGQIRVAVPEHTLRSDLRAASIVWQRELIRFQTPRASRRHVCRMRCDQATTSHSK